MRRTPKRVVGIGIHSEKERGRERFQEQRERKSNMVWGKRRGKPGRYTVQTMRQMKTNSSHLQWRVNNNLV